MNANEPAFPNSHDNPTFTARGLTKREYFAALALQGLLSNSSNTETAASDAITAVRATDVMLAELARTEPKESSPARS